MAAVKLALANQITIWNINLKVNNSELAELELLLSKDEKIRADRYKFDLVRRRFIVARANLRLILSKYLDISPLEIEFSYGAKGKPFLAQNLDLHRNLQFNLSHSEDMAVCAIAADIMDSSNLLGIDLEYHRGIDNVKNLAKRLLSPEEFQLIQNLASQSEQEHLFLRIWTVKEAYLKARGCGLGQLSSVSTIWQNDKIIGLSIPSTSEEICDRSSTDWQVYQFFYPQNYIGSLVTSTVSCDAVAIAQVN